MDEEAASPRQTSVANYPNASPHSLQPRTASFPDHEAFSQSQLSTSGMDMRSLGNALPEYPRLYPLQSFQQYPGHQNNMYQYAQGPQFAGQTGGFNLHSTPMYPQHYPQSRTGGFQGQGTFPSQAYQSTGPHLSHGMVQNIQGYPSQQQFLYPSSHYSSNINSRSGNQSMRGTVPTGPGTYSNPAPHMTRTSSNSSAQAAASSVLRGPPRKPKQSGHALWVGNLPPGTNILDLKDHFSRDATNDIESVFLISKSNCAFVNYNTEESCQAAMTRFHDSRFHGVRLVCRLRRGSTAPAASEPRHASPGASTQNQQEENEEDEGQGPLQPQEKVKEKFFVVKSLTVEDLERSVHSGVWATQAHNEASLSKAYETAEDVYLVFSANKSGEYFGYARMESAIGDEEIAAKTDNTAPAAPMTSIDKATPSPKPKVVDAPMTIPTAATATAPKGRIVDDSSRGTIFWESLTSAALHDSDAKENSTSAEEDPNLPSVTTSGNESSANDSPFSTGPGTPQSFGKPFKITWVSTERLPFFRTRGLRNPWNANREVKIARDGTEIEPSVGRRLIGMFGMRFPDPVPVPQLAHGHGQMSMQMPGQMPHMGGGGEGRGPMSPQMMGHSGGNGGYMGGQTGYGRGY